MTIAFIRTLILYVVVITALRLMGKRQIGELAPSELVVTILISDLASIPMQDPGISILNGIIPILTLLAVEILVSTLLSKSMLSRKLIVGSSSILIDDGKINESEIRRLRLSVDEIVEELRLKDYPDITFVKYAILETNGKISIIPKPEFSTKECYTIPVTFISDGKIKKESLAQVGKSKNWLTEKVRKQGFKSEKEILLFQFIPEDERIIVFPKAYR